MSAGTHPTCGWCGTHNAGGRTSCVNCGGPLAPLPGHAPDPAPPAPRTIPEAAFSARITRSARRFGGSFIALGGGLTLAFVVGAVVLPLMLLGTPITLLFVAVGAGFVWSAQKGAQKRIAVLRDGHIASGAVSGVTRDGEGGWRLAYTFDVGGMPRTGTIASTDAEITRFVAGSPLQVVYLDEGAASDVWPPLG